MGALAQSVDGVEDPFMIEAMAAVKCLQFAKDMRFNRIVIEGDSVGIISWLNSTQLDFSAIGMVLAEGIDLIGHFSFCSIIHTRREGNVAARGLAKYGLSLDQEVVWMEEDPPFIYDVLCNDADNDFI
ncbi:hypothetical protein PTKIN_Ptkin14bG0035700 [Pterospermum kingtungense]